jgi:hypothetical protein
MYKEMPYAEWSTVVKQEFAKAGLQLPEDEEMLELSHMECRAEQKSIEIFIKESIAEQKGTV